MSTRKVVLLSIGAFIVLVVLAFSFEWFGIGWDRYFGAQHETTKRIVFENSRSFNEGKKQDLVKYRLEYTRAQTLEDKQAIASAIRMTFADYDTSKLQPELRTFVDTILAGGTP